MKFFLDTANLDQIREAVALGVLDGITTNPTLMAKEGIRGEEAIAAHYRTICELVDGDISAEVLTTSFDTMVAEGRKLAAIHPNIVVKVPMTRDGVKAIKWFSDNGIRTNCTLIFSAGQAMLAAKAGAAYVSPFIGRLDDTGWDGMLLIEQIAHIFSVQGDRTEILAASIRNANHIVRAAELGAHVCTCPLDSILGLLKHPLTDSGLAKFLEDAQKMGEEKVVVEDKRKI
jgi:transaldolase